MKVIVHIKSIVVYIDDSHLDVLSEGGFHECRNPEAMSAAARAIIQLPAEDTAFVVESVEAL